MSKNRLSVKDWVLSVFGGSHKKISESMSAEEFNTFVSEAGALRPRSDTSSEADEEEAEEEESEASGGSETPDPKAEATTKTLKLSEYNTLIKQKDDAEAKVKQLEESEKKLQSQLEQKESYIKKLKQSLNPNGEKDLNNGDTEPVLTQADKEARQSWSERGDDK